MNDLALISRAQAGEREAVIELLRELELPVYRTAFYLMKNEHDARDASQEALLKIYRYLPTFKGEASFLTWVQRIVSNVCMDMYRKQSKVVPIAEDGAQLDYKGSKEVESGGIAIDLKSAINALPDLQRQAIVLRYIHDYNYQMIAETMDLPLNTVKSHLFRARKKLQECLQDYQDEGGTSWTMKS
ncbi:RNA polymerase sigma factor [Hazenella sp. IB182353]|uniref:RNA polymerase sigma factor n=1 Tax=Polycladospora coralii TaxID=2771432 RepID=UPI00174773EB|nr:RNA polymerase sigma factor [Polycladospora coralii]MBS7530056.1 RNA polymerase sigma factor [Polycladospora coralii]